MDTAKIREMLQKCQAWIDDENYIPKRFTVKNGGDEFAELIRRELEETIIDQKFGFENGKIYLPTKYFVCISCEDDAEFYGLKKQILIRELNDFILQVFKMLAAEYEDENFIQIQLSSEVKKGEVRIVHRWRENYAPQILFNRETRQTKSVEDDFSEETIIVPAFRTDKFAVAEDETVVKPKPRELYRLNARRGAVKLPDFPVFQTEITIGRGSASKPVDISLAGDLEISRIHAVLNYWTSGSFGLSVSGQNPVLIGGQAVYAGQTATLGWSEKFQIGSYVLQLEK